MDPILDTGRKLHLAICCDLWLEFNAVDELTALDLDFISPSSPKDKLKMFNSFKIKVP